MLGSVIIFRSQKEFASQRHSINTAVDVSFACACPGQSIQSFRTAPKNVLVSIWVSDSSCRCANFVPQIFMPAVNSDAPDINQATWEGWRHFVAQVHTIDWACQRDGSSAQDSGLSAVVATKSVHARPSVTNSVKNQIICHSPFKFKFLQRVFVNANFHDFEGFTYQLLLTF